MITGNKFGLTVLEPRIAKTSFGPIDTARTVNSFLFADVGVPQNGMMLSVISMLSQQGVDPWDEAALLATCPARAAVARLASRIADASVALPNARDPSAVAVDLIRLLPPHNDGLPSSPLYQQEVAHTFRFDAGGKPPRGPRRESGFVPDWSRNPDYSRLLTLFLASLTLAAIGIAAPRDILSHGGGANPAVSTAQPTTAGPAHPHPWYR
jgi:hypothetical protein